MEQQRTTYKPTQIAALGLAVIAISGCAEMGSLGKYAWEKTENVADFLYKPVASLLRETPEQAYVFDDTTDYDIEFFAESDVSTIAPYTPVNETHSDIKFSTQNYAIDIFETQTVYAGDEVDYADNDLNYFDQDDSLEISGTSFVKIGGGSNMQDWMNCETEAGGYMTWKNDEYVISQDFEICMRINGYVLEDDLKSQDAF